MKIVREFAQADRYVYDFGSCSYANGFAQIDTRQDASYFGTWCSPERRMIVNYCEGDVTIQRISPHVQTETAPLTVRHPWLLNGRPPLPWGEDSETSAGLSAEALAKAEAG